MSAPWLVLRMAGPRTLKVADALASRGLRAWTPKGTERRRRPRSDKYLDREVALLPGFVFVGDEHLAELIALIRSEALLCPSFSILQHDGQFPTASDRAIEPLRQFEVRMQEQWAGYLDALAKKAKGKRKRSAARAYVLGQRVKVEREAFAGLEGRITEIRKNGDLKLEFTGFINTTVVPSCDVTAIQLQVPSSEQDKAA